MLVVLLGCLFASLQAGEFSGLDDVLDLVPFQLAGLCLVVSDNIVLHCVDDGSVPGSSSVPCLPHLFVLCIDVYIVSIYIYIYKHYTSARSESG